MAVTIATRGPRGYRTTFTGRTDPMIMLSTADPTPRRTYPSMTRKIIPEILTIGLRLELLARIPRLEILTTGHRLEILTTTLQTEILVRTFHLEILTDPVLQKTVQFLVNNNNILTTPPPTINTVKVTQILKATLMEIEELILNVPLSTGSRMAQNLM